MDRIIKVSVVIISITLFANFIFTAGVGVYKTIQAYFILFSEGLHGKPGLEIVESLDLFLVAIVFLILSLSFLKLFYPEFKSIQKISLPWLKVEDFFELKHLTWNAILLTLLITFGTHVLRASGPLDWTILIIPASVLLFSISLKMLKS
jgi:uncharacterized membrane protein YqhA